MLTASFGPRKHRGSRRGSKTTLLANAPPKGRAGLRKTPQLEPQPTDRPAAAHAAARRGCTR
eukprot:7373517-Lingulodinium_polyedra.AAC.1